MFRIVCDPSSGSVELYWTEIRSGSLMFVVCLVGVWQRNFEPVVCVYGTTGWEQIKTNATMWFNKVSKIMQLKPNHIHFRTNSKTIRDRQKDYHPRHQISDQPGNEIPLL